MPLTIENRSIQQEKTINLLMDGFKQFLINNLVAVQDSQKLFNVGVNDDFVSAITNSLHNPFTFMCDGFKGHSLIISSAVETAVIKFFFSQKENISAIFRTNDGISSLNYAILLKTNSLEIRRPFFKFLSNYSKENLSEYFPIYFDFIDDADLDSLKKEKEILLNTNGGASKSSEA